MFLRYRLERYKIEAGHLLEEWHSPRDSTEYQYSSETLDHTSLHNSPTTLNPPKDTRSTSRIRHSEKYFTTTNINMSHQQSSSGSGSGSSRSSPPGGSQTNWNDVLRYSSPIGVVKTDVVYGVYNTSGSKNGQGSSSSSSGQGSGSSRR